MTDLELPAPPQLWDLYELIPWQPDTPRERRVLRDIIEFELVGNIWFCEKADRSITAVPLTDNQIYQIRPA